MLQSVQRGRSLCTCLLRSAAPATSTAQIREYQNPYTQVFERLHPLGMVGKDKYPRLKRKHYILKRVMPVPGEYKYTMKCILTKEVPGVGLLGETVEVKKHLFRNRLLATGAAVYASPENIKKYEKYRMLHERLGLSYSAKKAVELLAPLHLPIYMSATNPWTLNKTHVRIAFRRIDIMLTEDNVSIPKEPITEPKTFIVDINLNNMIFTKVRATIYPTNKGEATNPDIEHRTWGNDPVVKDEPVWVVTQPLAPEKADSDTTCKDSEETEIQDNTGEVKSDNLSEETKPQTPPETTGS